MVSQSFGLSLSTYVFLPTLVTKTMPRFSGEPMHCKNTKIIQQLKSNGLLLCF